ncbi:MAG: DUF1499 domain-containing protein [Pseudomonadota bacterium]
MRILIGLLIVIALIAGGLFYLAQQSKSGAAPGLASDGRLTPCPSSPNCVTSEAGADEGHAIAALPADAWEKLPAAIEAAGGKIVRQEADYIAAEFKTKIMGFIDDVEFRRAEDVVHVRSASRVGESDFGENAKRVEALRAALAE